MLLFNKNKNVGIKSRKVSGQNQISAAAERSRTLAILLMSLLWLVVTVILNLPKGMANDYEIVETQKAPTFIFAQFDYTFVDEIASAKQIELVKKNEPLFYNITKAKNDEILSKFTNLLQLLKAKEQAKLDKKSKAITSKNPLETLINNLSENDFNTLNAFNYSPEKLTEIQQEIEILIGAGVIGLKEKNQLDASTKIRVIDLVNRERAVKPIGELVDSQKFAELLAKHISDKASINNLLMKIYENVGNLEYDKQKTEQNREKIAKLQENVVVHVQKGEPLVRKNEIITPEIKQRVEAYAIEEKRITNKKSNYGIIIQRAIFSFVSVLFLVFYMYNIHPDVMNNNFKLLIMSSITILALIINYISLELFVLVSRVYDLNHQLLINFIPIALASVILVTMIGFRVAIYIGFFLSSIIAVMTSNSFEFAFIGIVLSTVTGYLIRSAKNHRAFFIRIFFSVAVCNWLLNANLPEYINNVNLIYQSALVAIFCGLTTAILAQTIIYFYEVVFNVTTNMSLMVLCDYSHPLLERLKREAPGTFYHSIMVSTLAEDAAIAIKANSIKAKCGALFHDIGKLEMPEYFTENNIDSANKHVNLSPQNSFVCIRNHVRDGLALAKKYKLNRVIKNAIVQHHGNDLSYFYYQANSLSHGEENVPEAQFRYHGTPPKSKEMVIISLADACEAAVCSIEKPTPTKIEAMVDEIFRKRFRDNQLINAEVTCGELKKIKDSFIANLVSMRHGRIAYKKEGEEDNEGDLFMESEFNSRVESKNTSSKKTTK